MAHSDVLALVGGQYGSEGKGAIAAFLAFKFDVHVRTGGPNAGHTFYHGFHDPEVEKLVDRKFVQQIIPCGWINPNAICILGRGMLVDLGLLWEELCAISVWNPGIWRQVRIDERAMVLDSSHHSDEGGVAGQLHYRIGSTGEGVGAARIARISRDPGRIRSVRENVDEHSWLRPLTHPDTPGLIRDKLAEGSSVLLEGTQGSGLSLIHGPWPYVTSADTNAAQLCADAGVPAMYLNHTMLVVRTYPIRVAGNSGPLPNEISWASLSKRLGKTVVESTTVTKKIRRVGEFDLEQVREAVKLNAPTSIALTFLDYVDPDVYGKMHWDNLSVAAKTYVEALEEAVNVPITLIQTGPQTTVVRNLEEGIRY